MIDRTVILLVNSAGSQTGAITPDGEAVVRDLTGPISSAGADRPRRLVVGASSSMCLSVTLPGEGKDRESRQALFYRLEEHVPMAAEDLRADFLPTSAGLLAISAAEASLQPMLAALNQANISCSAVCPTSLLAMQHILATEPALDDKCDALLWEQGETIEVFFLQKRLPTAWFVVPACAADVTRVVSTFAPDRPLRIAAIGLKTDVIQALLGARDWTVFELSSPATIEASATSAAEAILDRRAVPMFDLRPADAPDRRRPGRRSVAARAMAGAFVVMCLALILVMILRGLRYQAASTTAEQQTRAAYAAVFPDSPVPLGVESRLHSTLSALGAGATPSSAASPAADRWLLPMLHHILSAMPDDVRFRVDSLRLDDQQFVMEGQVLAFPDASALAAGLRGPGQLLVDEPQCQRTENAVAFTLTGRSPSARPGKGELAK